MGHNFWYVQKTRRRRGKSKKEKHMVVLKTALKASIWKCGFMQEKKKAKFKRRGAR